MDALLRIYNGHFNHYSEPSHALVPQQIKRGKLPNGYYSNPTFYSKELNEPLGFIAIHGHKYSLWKTDFVSLNSGEILTNFVVDNITQLMV